jgi:hypothetical protein
MYRDFRFWHFALFAAPHHFGRYWSNSGHWAALALNASVANAHNRHDPCQRRY